MPRICEVLNLNVYDLFKTSSDDTIYYIDDNGQVKKKENNEVVFSDVVFQMIEHPETIIKVEVKELTNEEIHLCKVVGARWIVRNADTDFVDLYETRPERAENGLFFGGSWICKFKGRFFPSIKRGDCLEVK